MTLVLDSASYGRLFQLSLELDQGLHVVVGSISDGTHDLLQLCSGEVAPSRGSVRIDGAAPHRAPGLRRVLGCAYAGTPFEERLVRDAVARRLQIHGSNATPESVLSRFGIDSLLGRVPRSLTARELHAVQLALALSLEAPKALFLAEPLALGAGSDMHTVLSAIRQCAERSIVVCATASPRTAALLAPASLLLEAGRFARSVPAATRPAFTPGAAARIRVECSHTELMAEALTRHAAVSSLSWQRGDSFLVVEGVEVQALSRAILALSVERQWWITQLTQVLPDPVEIRATHAALARAAYEATHHRAQADRGEHR